MHYQNTFIMDNKKLLKLEREITNKIGEIKKLQKMEYIRVTNSSLKDSPQIHAYLFGGSKQQFRIVTHSNRLLSA